MHQPRRAAAAIAAPIAAALSLLAAVASADVLPPQAAAAAQRLRDNPKAWDRADQFCAGKSVGAACMIPGDALSGGGAGVCRNGLDESRTRINLDCQRRATVTIDRGLPLDGFTLPAQVCGDAEGAAAARSRGVGCSPPAKPPQDRFCAGREVGAACTAELLVDGKPVRERGVCARVTETAERFYFRGWQLPKREVVQCASAKPVERRYQDAGWWRKARQ